ncbi:MAG: protein kinase [Acidobacteriota bacterium]|nr:protein kinase [Acidobacteriota bacterium]
MFYCPKCRRTYEDGSQRFCSNDGGRLLPALSAPAGNAEGKRGVFSTLLAKSQKQAEARPADENLAPAPKFIKVEQTIQPDFPPPAAANEPFTPLQPPKRKLEFEPKPPTPEGKPKTEAKPPIETRPATEAKPSARMIKPSEIASGTAKVGDRSVNPAGRAAISWENPNVLLGQTVKGRYRVTEKIGQDETSVSYLAHDKLSPEKKVVVRVLMEEDAEDLASRIFAEERVSLSHLNHPNVAGLIDSGELLEGKPFIISEYVAGKSLKDKLRQSGQFNALRAARIVRQAAYALSEVHQNGVLHRNLKPENIILTVNDAGTEQVLVTDFAVSDGRRVKGGAAYKSPEQLEGKMPSFASDIYSLAVIAYQMLTNRLPFAANSAGDLIAAQEKGLTLNASNLRLDLPPLVDEILRKALAYKPSERYPKARDFGDAFFNALTTAAPASAPKPEAAKKISEEIPTPAPLISADTPLEDIEIELIDDEPEEKDFDVSATAAAVAPAIGEKVEKRVEEKIEPQEEVKPKTEDLPSLEKRAPETAKAASKSRLAFTVLGLIALGFGLWALWYYFQNQPNRADFNPPAQNQTATTTSQPENPTAPVDDTTTATNAAPPAATAATPDIELPPAARRILPPANTAPFVNTRENLKGDLAKYYRGFSFYYPKDWVKTPSEKNFADVARKNENDIPIEQMLVTYYDSKGTFKADREAFPALVKETNKRLAGQIPNYRFVSEGERVINGGWKVYEMRFEGTIPAKSAGGESLKIFGRRLFMPAMRQGIKSGFIITMLATPLSPNVQTVNDVGEKGELRTILETFEPSPM